MIDEPRWTFLGKNFYYLVESFERLGENRQKQSNQFIRLN